MKLTWSRFANADRSSIFDYIEQDNPAAAARMDERIRDSADMLRKFLDAGREGRVSGTRELVIAGTPYIAIYRRGRISIRVLRVLHGAQRWPEV